MGGCNGLFTGREGQTGAAVQDVRLMVCLDRMVTEVILHAIYPFITSMRLHICYTYDNIFSSHGLRQRCQNRNAEEECCCEVGGRDWVIVREYGGATCGEVLEEEKGVQQEGSC